jgi:predicted Zn-dependent protease with MMP-like domain
VSTGSESGLCDEPEITDDEFDRLVDLALDSIPAELAALIDNVVVIVEDDAPPDDPHLLGRYEGVALTERAANHAGYLPDRIVLFRRPLREFAPTRDELAREIEITVVHEVAHHFGFDDARIHELGYG